MAEATVAFSLGAETVTSVLEIDLPTETILTGDIDAVVLAGTTARLRGNCRLVNNLHVRGTLIADTTGVVLDGQNLWDIHTHDGGVLDLQGVEKTAWLLWGETPTGWEIGDRLAVAPNVPNVYVVAETTWQGSWAVTTRPANSPDFTLRDGRIMRPEVANLSQTLTIKNMTRVMFHESGATPAVQTLKWLRVLDSGIADSAGFYPIHFHTVGEASRGSLLEGVAVEGGKQYAFVAHGSHGVTFNRCAAVNTRHDAYWWDPPGSTHYVGGGLDPSNDITYDHCLALGINTDRSTTSGFRLAEGIGGKMLGCRVAAFPKPGADGNGAHWRFGTDPWEFTDFVAHNIQWHGIHVWQNDQARVHLLDQIVAYNCGHIQNGKFYGGEFDHGAYGNLYHYRDIYGDLFRLHAKSEGGDGYLTIERADLGVLEIAKHALGRWKEAKVIDSTIGQVVYSEAGGQPSWIEYRDCGLTPSDFTLTGIRPTSVIEIFEADVLAHRWASGTWS